MLAKTSLRSSCRAARLSAVTFASVAAIVLMASLPVRAATYTWAVSTGDWSVASNWGGTLPTSNDAAYVFNGGVLAITQTGATCSSLSLGGSKGGTVQMSGGGFSATDVYSAIGGAGAIVQSGGNANETNLYLGYNVNDSGTYAVSGTGVLSFSYGYVGYSGTGSLTQSGGTAINVGGYNLEIAGNPGSSGTYTINSGQASVEYEYVGFAGTGTLTQTGGTNNVSEDVRLGWNAGSQGTYYLTSATLLPAGTLILGNSGAASFVQSGGAVIGTNTGAALSMGLCPGSTASYSLGGLGQLTMYDNETIGESGSASFTQSSGVNSVANWLILAANAGGYGSYTLNGGVLAASLESISSSAATASFRQTGGSNTTAFLNIVAGGRYVFSGGTLNINTGMNGLFDSGGLLGPGGGISNLGTLDFSNCTGTVLAGSNSIVDLSHAVLTNVGSMRFSIGANSLLTIPAGFNPSTAFRSYSCLAIVHTAGTTLTITAGQGFAGAGSINDPVNCQGGTITATASGFYRYINLDNGLVLSGNGNVNLGFLSTVPTSYTYGGVLTVNDALSGITGGTLVAGYQYVGSRGTGSFSQTAGSNTNLFLYLGYGTADSGSYGLGGGATLSTGASQYVGYSGTGNFTQTGGSNTVISGGALYLGYNTGSSGTYNLSGKAQLIGASYFGEPEYVGYSGSGSFIQSGGTNIASYGLDLGYNSGASGTYNLAGGSLSATENEDVGVSGTGTFTQSGGTNSISNSSELGIGSKGTYNLNGGVLIPQLLGGAGSAAFNFNGGMLQASSGFTTTLPMNLGTSGGGATFDTAGFAVTLSGSLSGPGSLTKLDSGTLALAAANTYTGNTLIGGGTLALGNSLALENSTLDTGGSGVLSYGTLTSATFGGLTGTGTLSLANTSSSAVALSVGNNNASTTFSGMLKGVGSLNKIGSGVLALSGSNTYTGPTTITLGKLVVDGWLPNSAVTVNGGTLGGTGHLSSGTVTAGGQIAPGNPLGTLHFSGGLVLSSGADMDFELDTPSTSSMISCSSLTLGGQQFSNFAFPYTANFAPGTYYLIEAGSSPSGTLGTSTSGTIDGYPASLAVKGNNLVLTVVPEPGTLALFGVGVGCLVGAGYVRRDSHRRKTASLVPVRGVEGSFKRGGY